MATIVFKDLHKLVSHSQQKNTRKELFERLQDKPFWICDKQQYKLEDAEQDELEDDDYDENEETDQNT